MSDLAESVRAFRRFAEHKRPIDRMLLNLEAAPPRKHRSGGQMAAHDNDAISHYMRR